MPDMILEILVHAPHCRDRKTEAQRGEVTSTRSHSQRLAEPYPASEERQAGRTQGAGARLGSPTCSVKKHRHQQIMEPDCLGQTFSDSVLPSRAAKSELTQP